MGKGKRLKKKRREKQKPTNNPLTMEQIVNIFSDDGLENLTDDLVKELLEKGHKEDELHFFQSIGAKYCRERDSFIEAGTSFGEI